MLRSLVCLLLICALGPLPADAKKPKRAKNVILLLADAGGVATVHAASIAGHGAPLKLFIQSWPHLALMDTSTANSWVSDSAAGMTALVTGQKTRNGVISQGADAVPGKQDGTVLKTILEYAEERGLATGVLSDVTIADATPAACYGHANIRRELGKLFLQIFEPRFGDGVDILFGPGRQRIYEAVEKEGQNLDEVARRHNRPILRSLGEVPADARRALAVVDGPIDLAEAARKAVRALSRNPKGFFLMIESDAHTNHPRAGLDRLVRFDRLIRELAGMVNLQETLLLFAADHSFDLRVVGGRPEEPLLKGWDEWEARQAGQRSDAIRLPFVRIDNTHTGEEVPVMAMGPGAERVRGYLPNTRIFEILLAAYGWSR